MARRSIPAGWALILLGLSFGASSTSAADGPGPAPNLPPAVEQALWWFPEDTETLIVARPFDPPDEPTVGPSRRLTWRDAGALLGLNGDDRSREGRPLIPALHDQLQSRVEALVMGGRRFEGVSSFGALRYEGCTIVRFADAHPADEDWAANYRRQAREVRTIAGREVFAFANQFTREPWTKPTDWEGIYIVLLDARTLLIATSDRYLAEILGRVATRAVKRALPDALPEWHGVDPQAPCWLLRHFPVAQRRARSVGVAATYRDDGFRVVYLAEPGREVSRVPIEKMWYPSYFKEEVVNKLRPRTRFERRPDGSLVLHYDAPLEPESEDSFLVFTFCGTRAAELSIPDEE